VTPRTCAAVLAAAALLAATAAPAPAQEGGDDGAAFEIRGLSAVAPLRTDDGGRALQLYRALIPDGLEPAPEPAVGVWLSELAAYRNGGRPQDDASHWMEGAIQLRVRGPRGIEGWYPIHYPVNAEFWHGAGRFVGLPKLHARTTMTAAGQGWRAEARPCPSSRGANTCTPAPGEPSMSLEWQPGAADAGAVARAFAVPTDPLLVLNRPLRGPELRRVQYRIGPPPPLPPQLPGAAPAFRKGQEADRGLVRLRLRDDVDLLQETDLPRLFPQGASLDDLIVLDQVVPGAHGFFAVGLTSEDETIGEGGYRERPGAPAPSPSSGGGAPPPRAEPAPRSCVSRRVLTLRIRAYPRARLRAVRVYVDGRRVRAQRLRGRRVRVSLAGRPAGRHRVTVVALQSRGLRTKASRVFRTCGR
jgi:hypothetical protein